MVILTISNYLLIGTLYLTDITKDFVILSQKNALYFSIIENILEETFYQHDTPFFVKVK